MPGSPASATDSSTTSIWWPSVLVAICALVFKVASFWWLNVRRGRLVSFEPHSFAAYYDQPLLLIRLPLVIHNTGPAPVVVQDMRLAFPRESTSVIPLPWRNIRASSARTSAIRRTFLRFLPCRDARHSDSLSNLARHCPGSDLSHVTSKHAWRSSWDIDRAGESC